NIKPVALIGVQPTDPDGARSSSIDERLGSEHRRRPILVKHHRAYNGSETIVLVGAAHHDSHIITRGIAVAKEHGSSSGFTWPHVVGADDVERVGSQGVSFTRGLLVRC